MRILVVGDWYSEVHEEGIYRAYQKLGHEVYMFKWHQYFDVEGSSSSLLSKIKMFCLKLQDKFIVGPTICKINRDLIKKVEECTPDMISVYRGTHVTQRTLRSIKSRHPSTCLVSHNEDDPFVDGHPYWLWRNFAASIPEYDLVLAHRLRNVEQYQQAGARNIKFLRSWYEGERTHPVTLSDEDRVRFDCDTVFVGHYEDDGRVAYLEEVVKNGFRLRLFGPGKYWDAALQKSPHLRHLVPVGLVWGEDYNKALCGARVALCFMSKLNQDTYTRRCFEIPATKTLLLSEYSDELSTLYRAGVEADFFKSKHELVQKLRHYLGNESLRASVAQAGYNRVVSDGHDVVSRMRQVLAWVAQCE
ncbi:MAG: glycosyltransferase [Candidatus Nitrotoga sp.]|jgi:spore maturation protein CgeB|nr:glycosyltransferase [Candidatus Nitrotoga sp.]